MRSFFTSILHLLWAGSVFGPAFSTPEVVDTRESIRDRIGLVSRTYFTCQSNIMAGIFETETGTEHHHKKGPKKGKIKISYKGATGAGQIMPVHGTNMNLNLYDLKQNIRAAHRVFHDNMTYYLKKGYGRRDAELRAIQAYWGGKVGRLRLRSAARRYMYKVLKVAEGKVTPIQYR